MFEWESDGCDATYGERVDNYIKQGFSRDVSDVLATEEMLTEIHAMTRFMAIYLRSSLSTAREEGRKEGLEEAANYHDDMESQHAAAHKHVESDHHMLMERQHRRFATAIRALKAREAGE